jgi:hypothetical protein
MSNDLDGMFYYLLVKRVQKIWKKVAYHTWGLKKEIIN